MSYNRPPCDNPVAQPLHDVNAEPPHSTITVLVAVTPEAARNVERGRFPDGSSCLWCEDCSIGCSADAWATNDDCCPECGAKP